MKMRTGYLSELCKVEVRISEVPRLNEQSVLIKVKAAGICGSDFHAFHGSHPFRRPPMVLGHEAAGEIVKVGTKVKGLKVGDRIAVEPLRVCGKCPACRAGSYNLCRKRVAAGLGGWLGTFAEYFVLPQQRAHKLPKELDYDLAVLAEPLAVGTHAVRIASVKKGTVCAVLGAGTIGLLAGVAAQEAGAKRVYCTELNPSRLATAKALGLWALNAAEDPVEETINAYAPFGVDVVLVAFPSPKALQQALRLVKRGGRVIVIALFTEPVTLDMNLLQEEVELKGSIYYTKEDFRSALRILVRRKKDLQQMVTHHVDLEGVSGALHMLADANTAAIKIIVRP